MANSILQTGPTLIFKIALPNGIEKTIGYASGLTYSSTQGQKRQMVVDTPFPFSIDQGAGPSMVTGSITLFVPKSFSLEAANIVAPRQDGFGSPRQGQSKYVNIRLYDRLTNELVAGINHCKVGQYTFTVQSRQIARYQLNFEGIYVQPGAYI